jgi:hypothetical protein
MTNKNLIKGSKERRGEKQGMLQVVKWVWDNSEMGLKDSKNFVDNN